MAAVRCGEREIVEKHLAGAGARDFAQAGARDLRRERLSGGFALAGGDDVVNLDRRRLEGLKRVEDIAHQRGIIFGFRRIELLESFNEFAGGSPQRAAAHALNLQAARRQNEIGARVFEARRFDDFLLDQWLQRLIGLAARGERQTREFGKIDALGDRGAPGDALNAALRSIRSFPRRRRRARSPRVPKRHSRKAACDTRRVQCSNHCGFRSTWPARRFAAPKCARDAPRHFRRRSKTAWPIPSAGRLAPSISMCGIR